MQGRRVGTKVAGMAAATPIFEVFTNACHTNILDSFGRCTIACHTNISDLLTALYLIKRSFVESGAGKTNVHPHFEPLWYLIS